MVSHTIEVIVAQMVWDMPKYWLFFQVFGHLNGVTRPTFATLIFYNRKYICKCFECMGILFVCFGKCFFLLFMDINDPYPKYYYWLLFQVFGHLNGATLDEKSKKGLGRLLAVWEERGVFSKPSIAAFKKAYGEALYTYFKNIFY